MSPLTAHPRACGENCGSSAWNRSARGSSPRVRGKLLPFTFEDTDPGLIPARAGKTSGARPRRGGGSGSSPRVRGKRGRVCRFVCSSRLIPARAGKTRAIAGSPVPTGAHPRACGENPVRPPLRPRPLGSSPRVRGKRGSSRATDAAHRLIPARAGKTASSGAPPGSARAHPRACGENWAATDMGSSAPGSSPRVRGKPAPCAAPPAGGGLIPARAGKTSCASSTTRRTSAHPRACGENW